MLKRQISGSIGCPGCGEWVSVQVENCPHCGYWNPGVWGYFRYTKALDADFFAQFIIHFCVILFVISLLIDPRNITFNGFLNFLGPSTRSLITMGGSGSYPLIGYHSWWTVFSAPYLHCGLIHLFFNLSWIKQLAHLMVKFYSFNKLVLIYTFSGICGSLLTTLAAIYLPPPFSGASLSAGASGAIFGLFGALFSYGLQSGNSAVKTASWQYALIGFIYGLLSQNVDNWCHLGGFLGGFVLTHLKWFNYKSKDNTFLFFFSLTCIIAVFASVLASIFKGIYILQVFKYWDN